MRKVNSGIGIVVVAFVAFANVVTTVQAVTPCTTCTVFVTSVPHDGDFDGDAALAGGSLGCVNGDGSGLCEADQFCNDLAASAGLSGEYVALLSTNTVAALSRPIDALYQRVDGVKIGDNRADLFDGSIDNRLEVDETGAVINVRVWTGSQASGLPDNCACRRCNEWIGTQEGVFGRTSSLGTGWLIAQRTGCLSTDVHVYCFQTAACSDADGDGYGSPGDALCPNGAAEDCDDTNAAINPGATEICDGVDNDCDTLIDEDFPDLGDACTVGVGECEESGTKVCTGDGSGTECDATPGVPVAEVCTGGVDEDCDGDVDCDDVDCDADPACAPVIPSVSNWGLCIAALLLFAGITLLSRRLGSTVSRAG